MEIKSIGPNGDRADIYDLTLFNLPLQVHNLTKVTLMTQPRRRYITSHSCEIYLLHRLKVHTLDRHWRPGEALPELNWLREPNKLKQAYQQDAISNFNIYCQDPIKFLLDTNNLFLLFMKDAWCFEHDYLGFCVLDFIQAYNAIYLCKVFLDDFSLTSELEAAWRKSFKSTPETADLITSGFLTISPNLIKKYPLDYSVSSVSSSSSLPKILCQPSA